MIDVIDVDQAQLAASGAHLAGQFVGSYRFSGSARAIRYLGYNTQEVFAVFRAATGASASSVFADSLILRGDTARVELRPGDWLVTTEAGAVFALPNHVFHALREDR